jgi:hypothetical protein
MIPRLLEPSLQKKLYQHIVSNILVGAGAVSGPQQYQNRKDRRARAARQRRGR